MPIPAARWPDLFDRGHEARRHRRIEAVGTFILMQRGLCGVSCAAEHRRIDLFDIAAYGSSLDQGDRGFAGGCGTALQFYRFIFNVGETGGEQVPLDEADIMVAEWYPFVEAHGIAREQVTDRATRYHRSEIMFDAVPDDEHVAAAIAEDAASLCI